MQPFTITHYHMLDAQLPPVCVPRSAVLQVTFVQVKLPPGSKELATNEGVQALLGTVAHA